jgi:hypothetical protein
VRDRHEHEPDGAEDGSEDHQRVRRSERLVEAEQRHQGKHAADHDQPRAADEQAARVVDVADPVETVLAGLRNQHLHAARRHQHDADDERDRRQDGAHRADGGEVRLPRPTIIRAPRRHVNAVEAAGVNVFV